MHAHGSQSFRRYTWRSWTWVLLTVLGSTVTLIGLLSLSAAVSTAVHGNTASDTSSPTRPLALAAPIPPPEGYPKLSLSSKTVTPTLANKGGATLTYRIEMLNTGATTATNSKLSDPLPPNVTYNGDARASHGSAPVLVDNTLEWTGEVGFDAAVVVTFSVDVDPAFDGTVRNTAVINDPLIARPVTVTAETVVTDDPLLSIEKMALSAKPGPNKPLVYELRVTNWGQPTGDQLITVTDIVPADTTLRSYGSGGSTSPISDVVTWTRQVNLNLGQSTLFSFTVDVKNVPSGTVIANENYGVAAPFGTSVGEPYTVTVVDPIFSISKRVWPDPPGSNREMTYTLALLNIGSLATNLTVTDEVPAGVSYRRGGTESSGVVSWHLPMLDTGESALFTYTVYISDVMNIPIVNSHYGVCSAEGGCQSGDVLTSVVRGPTFEARAFVDPIAKGPGGGNKPVTPTLVVHNLGPGSALSATAILYYWRISVQDSDLYADPNIGEFSPGPDCGEQCVAFAWDGSLAAGKTVTFTTYTGQNSRIGEEGTLYTATVVITDGLSNTDTAPVIGTAAGVVTHFANVIPTKSALPVIGPGQLMTYTIHVWNSGLSTLLPPVLTDVIPANTTFVRASDGGVAQSIGDISFVSWALPALSTGDEVVRTFSVRVDDDLISGTQIVNHDYSAFGYGNILTDAVTSGPPVTTTVQEVGLIHSYKVVTPQLSLPGPGNILTYEVHLVNSSALSLKGVTAHDVLPWADSTFLRDATASAGALVSDIVSIDWQGDIDPFSSVVLTGSVLVDEDYSGTLTNTVVISHRSLLAPVVRHAIAYITARPLLFIEKSATPDPVDLGELLTYRLRVTNLGQQATGLVVTDVLPTNVEFAGATGDGKLFNDTLRWEWTLQESGEKVEVSYQVTVVQGMEVVNERYGVRSAEGVGALGPPVVTKVGRGGIIFLPLVVKLAP